MKTKALFVDDEPNILSGLKRMLRIMREEMDFLFAESGQEALEILSSQHVDVIVSDMRMPVMDGATLLATVQERYPHVIRVMLTGQANDEAILRTVGVAHQFLAKPATPDALKAVLLRGCALQKLLKNKQLKSLVSSIDKLPSLPAVYAELQKKLIDPDCSISDVATIIEKDMAMSAKVLQLVNSAFFGLFKNIDSQARAVNLLGLDTVKALVLGVGVFAEMTTTPSKHFSVTNLWNHSMGTAALAKKIAMAETNDKQCIDASFIAGMMHDVGKLLLFATLHDEFIQAVTVARQREISLCHAERQTFSTDHADVGSYLMSLWGLPGSVVEAIAFHHRLDEYPEPSFSPAVAVHAANVIYYRQHPETSVGAPPEISQCYLEQAGLADRFPEWTELCLEIEV